MEETKKYAGMDIRFNVQTIDEGTSNAINSLGVTVNLLPPIFLKDMKPSDAESLGRLYLETFAEHLKRKLPTDYDFGSIVDETTDFKTAKWDEALYMALDWDCSGKAVSVGGKVTANALWAKAQEAHQETIKKLGQSPRLPRKGLI